MKPELHSLLRVLTVCVTPATGALSGMIAPSALAASGTWTGAAGDNLYNTAGNWSGAAAPTVNGDIASWNGTQGGDLSILWNAQVGTLFGNGVGLVLTSLQTASVTLSNTANNSSFGLTGISIASGAGAFTLGGATGTPTVNIRTGATGGSLDPLLLNDSTVSTATIKSNVVLQSGGGSSRALIFDGAGNWLVEARLSGFGAFNVVKNGAGTLTSTNPNNISNIDYTVNAGKLVVGGAGLLGGDSGVYSGTLALTGALSYESSASQTISSGITGTGTLVQTAGTLTLTGNNTHSGGTTIYNGTLRIQGGNAGQVTIHGAGAVLAGTSGNIIGPVALINGGIAPGDGVTPIGTLALGGNLFLSPTNCKFNFDLSSVDNSSDLLTLNGLFDGGGTVAFNFSGGKVGETYTLLGFATTNILDASAFLTTRGTGTFDISSGTSLTYTVTSVAEAGGYASWAAAKGLSAGVNDGTGQDPDFDGISNLLEYVLGGLPIGESAGNASILPVQTLDETNITFTFKRSDLSEADTTQAVQTSPDLGTWTNFATVGDVSAAPVTVTEDSPTADLDTVRVIIPRSGNAENGKLFVRLQAVKQP